MDDITHVLWALARAAHALSEAAGELTIEAAGQFDHADDQPKRRGWSKRLAAAA